MKRILLVSVLLLTLAGLPGCSSDNPMAPSSANVRIFLTDAPLDLSTVSAVNVTLSEFTLYPAGSGNPMGEGPGIIMDVPPSGELRVNLLDYQNGAVILVASGEVPEGDYRRIRMVISAAELSHDHDGDPDTPDISEPILIESDKVDVPMAFSLTGGEGLEITLDFDAEQSVLVNTTLGQPPFILRPVVTPVRMTST